MRDPIDDLFATPDADVNVFDALEADVPTAIALSFFRAMHDSAVATLEAHLVKNGEDGDEAGLRRCRSRVQQAVNALEWVMTQRGPEVRLRGYPVDPAVETALIDDVMAKRGNPGDVPNEELGLTNDQDMRDLTRDLRERIAELKERESESEDQL